ncbi:UvrD-helicase domain-containing protein [Candidatus Vallotia cooleyia]|uniref:UvrD-helicase domain-containing protein n=1 Tax=Candidatus Vallotiella adelgis TaxID=1177211 RepID=UPI001D0294A5|nr:UvrD-helicase domain-containing protein [Candidatus Vallotia cooleyia]
MSDFLANLNPEQCAAVTLPNEPALILAGAGSGKTRVLITRIAWLISRGKADPSGILAVTFTNKAAHEMLVRLEAMLPVSTRNLWIGTFHGLCNRMLRSHYGDAGLPQSFQILDAADQLSIIKRLMKSLKIDDEKYSAKNFQYFINNAKEQNLRSEQVDANDNFHRKCVELYAAYEQQCQREGVVDFSELQLRCYELLQHNPALRAHYQARFHHILVDEFQDTNKLQYAWLKLLAGQNDTIFAVGDDDQSIYAFRGANVGNMLDFKREFNVQHLIKLERNYRSHGNILDTANALIAHNSKRLGKNLRTDAGHGKPVLVYRAMTDSQEASWVVEEIRALIDTGLSLSAIAVLYRSNAQSRIVEHTLINAGIPYQIYGGLRFFERQEVKHALAYLRLIINRNDDTAFVRVVNFPARGIGARSLEQLADAARLYNCSMVEAIPYIFGKAGQTLGRFLELIELIRSETYVMSLPDMVEAVIRLSGLEKFYANERDGQERIDNLLELVNAANAFASEEGYSLDIPAHPIPLAAGSESCVSMLQWSDNNGGRDLLDESRLDLLAQHSDEMTPLAGFLAHASLEAGDNQLQNSEHSVKLMTVHAAKGLEFSAVFITGLEEGLFPHENSMIQRDGLEEERRLMYVAITRAKEQLYLSFAQSRMLHGQTRYNVRSRFFDELPNAVLKWLSPKREHSPYLGKPGKSVNSSDSTKWRKNWSSRGGGSQKNVHFDDRVPAFSNQHRTSKSGFWIGQPVFHEKFGEGKITALEGEGENAKAQVIFNRRCTKWLVLAVAKLRSI